MSLKRLMYFATTLCVVVLLAFATAAVAQQQEETAREDVVGVSIRDNYFDPADDVVAPGTTVKWVNEGENPQRHSR